ncbi:unnamed protein product [Schistosoma margrebowiei]|uniref:Uncharacterized protein n=1 Tax=Schistosoma margrebowiei TaxID=48269 RepID=A0A183LV00_9TREM|nr:unnamed protein product [Schistosoma margrebowiei]
MKTSTSEGKHRTHRTDCRNNSTASRSKSELGILMDKFQHIHVILIQERIKCEFILDHKNRIIQNITRLLRIQHSSCNTTKCM